MLILSWLLMLFPFLAISYVVGYTFFLVYSEPDDISFTVKVGVGSFFLAGATSLLIAIGVALLYLVRYYS